jgi:integrase
MYRDGDGRVVCSASDLVGQLACGYLTELERAVAAGKAKRPFRNDPALTVLVERGREHETRYLTALKSEGKPQLRIDEARKWVGKATEMAAQGEAGAVAALVSLLMGMRASEITTRVARDLDDGGRLLWIPDAKTEGGKRILQVPEVLQPYLRALAEGKTPQEKLFGDHWRTG